MASTWEPYDSRWLVALAELQHPDAPWLADALKACTQCRVASAAYIYFVDAVDANQPRSSWQFSRNLFLECPHNGTLILDILKDNKVGGLEFYDKLFDLPAL